MASKVAVSKVTKKAASPEKLMVKRPEVSPDERKLTQLQARRMAHLAGVSQAELEGVTMAAAAEKLKWHVDPLHFLFRRVCGKVVKRDPVTGVDSPVPFATVHVEDTDCHFVSYFPTGSPWGWYFPFHCHREEIAHTKTDACGEFCVWVPRFDIDFVLRWRKRLFCHFRRPWLGDLIPRIPVPVDGPWPPIDLPWPGPDPRPWLESLSPSVLEAVAGKAAGRLSQRVAQMKSAWAQNRASEAVERAMQERAFETELPPPLPAEFQKALSGKGLVAAPGAKVLEGMQAHVAMKLGVNAKELGALDLRHFIGPFFHCHTMYVPEWQLLLEVPDITFRVTQDVDGDGVEENVYSESFADVRWDADPLPYVTLLAQSNAKETQACNPPPIDCGGVPAILFAGLMPLNHAGYFDAANGYAIRPNRPSLDGSDPSEGDPARPAAETPFCQAVQLYGCADVGGAKYYRILRSTDGGATFTAITGLAWNIYTVPGGMPITVSADADGWYAVDPHPGTPVHPDGLLLNWPVPSLGKSVLKVETGTAGKTHLAYSAPVAIQTDNTTPTVVFTALKWKLFSESESAWRNLSFTCPIIRRGLTPQKIEVMFEASVSAHHLRDARIWTSGCGGGAFDTVSGHTSHWHTSGADNAVLLNGRYSLEAAALEGAYGFHCLAYSRAMNPSGADGGNMVPPDWNLDTEYIWAHPSLGVAVVNANE